jgi:H+/Cl- antiporter ClcA
MDQQTGKYIIIAGVCILLAGILIYFFHDYFKWLGKLPGDIRIEKENFRFYFPIVTMLVISIVITLIVNVIKRLL